MHLPDRLTPSMAVLVALLVVCSSAASVTALAGATATAPAPETASTDAESTMADSTDAESTMADSTDATQTTNAPNDTVEQADEVYVHENGDAVLVYNQSSESTDTSTATGHLGLNVTEGLMHVLVRDDVEDETNVTGDAQVVLEPSSLAGNGSFQAPRPETLENLDVDVTAERTPSDASARATFDATYVDDSEYSTTSSVESASTSGELSVSANEFTTSGSASAEYAQDLGTLQHREYTLEEGTNQYRLQASEEYYVSSYFAEQWNSRENATETIERQYASIASSLGGSADVTVESYDFATTESGRQKLDIEYTIMYSNVDDALGQQVAAQVTNAEDVDVSTETAQAVGDGVADLEVDRVHASVDAEGKSMQASWDVELSNYEPLVMAGLDLAAEASEDENVTEQVETARTNYEAMQASGLVQTVSWDGSMSSPSENAVRAQGTVDYGTQNYEAYASELEARGEPVQGTMSFSASAQTEGEQVVAEMEYSMEQEDLVDQTLGNLLQSAQSTGTGADTQNVQRFVRAFQRSDFEKAKMNVDVAEEEVQFQAGASFENMSSFRDVMEDEFGGDVASMYADLDDDSKAYVHVTGAFDENASESAVREHEAVDEETRVIMPGDWNSSTTEFPKMDQEEARDYLDIEDPDDETTNGTNADDGDSSGLPGFGMPAAFAAVAVVSALLLARVNRRDD
ncbi:hypothetical protein G9C85_07165 [Halorubellus sp. JP-L1]|uniref:hypothetical protein n=1 Tax=Halorubellus sp. JP-L1 TaxID=2715753 RepID=UPI0014096040|nr:hypothetical protein [Halorubellus sp. JP-L1]NHN41416.1 hypothetical protein [Halorubellus sp. JP-L1]